MRLRLLVTKAFQWIRGTGALLLLVYSGARGQEECGNCRYYLEGGPFLAGATGQRVTLRCDNDVTLYGFSFGINYDEAMLRVTSVSKLGTAAANADYYDGTMDPANGLVGFGCIFDTGGSFAKRLDPGAGQALAILTVNILSATDGQATMAFENVQIKPPPAKPVKNLMTDHQGFSILPTVANAGISIETRLPVITSIENNSGLFGKVFQVAGNFFGEPNRSVTVCGTTADATLRDGGRILDVTAPWCETIGCVEVKVCTVRGCDSVSEGYCYDTPLPPAITGIGPSQGKPGTLFVISGQNFDPRGLVVRVCGMVAAIGAPTDAGTRVQAMAPSCPVGAADVQLCNDFGCDTEPGGFTYVADPIPVISSIDPDEGRAGTVFTITGENFDRPQLVVKVCGVEAAHGPPANGGTELGATAPPCAVGPADVEVCTDVGCTSVPGGFRYLPDPVPKITSIDPVEGRAGTMIHVAGENFDQRGLLVRICGVEAVHVLPRNGGTELDVTAPLCGSTGPVEVQVCTDFGCASDPDGFTYLPIGLSRFVRGDADSNGQIELTDGVRILNYLFTGGRAPTCDDAADTDDKGDHNITDGILVLNWLFTGGRVPPPPSPSTTTYAPGDCGADPTADVFGCESPAAKCGI